MVAEIAELLAEVENVRVHAASAPRVAIAPDAREQLLPREHATDPLDEKTQQLKFERRQRQRFVIPIGLPHFAVEDDFAVTQLKRRSGPTVSRLQLPQSCSELLGGGRNQDEIVRTRLCGERNDARHFQADEDPRRDQLWPLPQSLDRLSSDHQMFPRLDDDHVDRRQARLQVRQVVTGDDHLVTEGAKHRRQSSGSRFVAPSIERHHDGAQTQTDQGNASCRRERH